MDWITDHYLHLLAVVAVFAPLEALLPRNRQRVLLRDQWQTDVAWAVVGWVLVSVVTVPFVGLAMMALEPLVPGAVREAVASQPIWLQVVEIIVLADVYYYAIHYAAHRIPLLWRFHAVHHSIETMDFTANYRVHPVDQAITAGSAIVLPTVLGFEGEALALFLLQFTWHSTLKHSNVRVGWGPLRWIFATPAFHHWHHTNVPGTLDKNFAGQLPILDLIFGTANMEERETPAVYGVSDPVPTGFVDQCFYPFRRAPALPEAEESGG